MSIFPLFEMDQLFYSIYAILILAKTPWRDQSVLSTKLPGADLNIRSY